MSENEDSPDPNGTNETERETEELSPERAFDLWDNQGFSYAEIAGMYPCSKTTVKRRVDTYKAGMEKGKESVSPNDFDTETLENALADKETENPFMHKCPNCQEKCLPEGEENCPECEAEIEWQ